MSPVYKQFNRQELDQQYNTRLSVPDFKNYFDCWEKQSSLIRSNYPCSANLSYGSHPLECMDIFPAPRPMSKTMIFIHGGYWHLLDKELFHFIAAAFLKNNITFVCINYPLAPAASIDEIVSCCKSAINWISQNIHRYNGDPSQLYVSGHSAGGHLATMLLTTKDILPLKGMISLSGIFCLEPIMRSYLNDVLGINGEMAARNSPIFLSRCTDCPVLLVYGKNESDEFRDQSIRLFTTWQQQTGAVELMEVTDKNHYSILDTVTDENSPVFHTISRMMNIPLEPIHIH